MSIKLIALDMDGTTLQRDHLSISHRTEQAIKSAVSKGILIVPSTGRSDSFLPQSVMNIPGIRYAITSNGAVTYDMQDQKIIYSDFIKAELVLEILKLIPTKSVLVEISRCGKLCVEKNYIETLSEYPIPFFTFEFMEKVFKRVEDLANYIERNSTFIEKISMPFVPPQLRQSLWEKLSALQTVAITSSIPSNMEINSATTNKGIALQKLCEFLQIPRESVMALGDNGNDIEMLKFAGTSVAMADGTEEAKAAATAVTFPNDEDGAARAIEKYALNL